MSDDLIREVLRSPLDDPTPSRSAWRGLFGVFLLGAMLGAGLALGVAAMLRAEPSPEPVGFPASSSTTTSTTSAGPVLVDGVLLELTWAHTQGDRLYLGVTTLVPPPSDPATIAGMESATWVIRLSDGMTVSALEEWGNPSAPGLFTVAFPAVDLADGAELLVYPVTEIVETRFPSRPGATRLPWSGPLEGAPYAVGGERLVVEGIRLDDAGGEIAWRLDGSSTNRAVVTLTATYFDAAPQSIVSEERLQVASLEAASTADPPARRATTRLYRLDDPEAPTFRSRFWGDLDREVEVSDLEVTLSVRLLRYAGEPVVIPLQAPAPLGS